MNKVIVPVVVFSFLTTSCSNNIYIKRDQIPPVYKNKINKYWYPGTGMIILSDGRINEACQVHLDQDSVIFKIIDDTLFSRIALNDVKIIKFSNHTTGTILGLPFGAAVGYGLAKINEDHDPNRARLNREGCALVGALIGALFSGIHGVVWNYVFVD